MAAPGRPPPVQLPFNEQLYNHIALPRDVPGHEDKNLRHLETALLSRLIDATRVLSSHVQSRDQEHLLALCGSLTTSQSMNTEGRISKPALLRELQNLQPERMLILQVSAQNCGLLIYNHYT